MTLARTTTEKIYKLRETAINDAFKLGFKEIIVTEEDFKLGGV